MRFCDKLRMLREERGLSLSEMGALLGTTKQVLSRYELGQNTPKITTVAHYAEVLGVSLTYFMNDECTDRHAETKKEATPTMSKTMAEITSLLQTATEEQKEQILRFIKFTLTSNK